MKRQIFLLLSIIASIPATAMDAPAAMSQGQETEQSLLNELPDEIKEKIAIFLTTAEGKTPNEQLFAAVKNIRALAGTNKSLYGIVNNPTTTNTLIQLLANHYANNSPLTVVAAFKTTAALEWLNAFLEKALTDVKLQNEITSTLIIALTVSNATTYWWLSNFIMDHISPSIVKLDPSIALIVLTELAKKKPTQVIPGFDALQWRKIIDYLVASSRIKLNDPVDQDHTLIFYALSRRNQALIEVLLDYPGIDLNVIDPRTSQTPLLTALDYKEYDIVKALLQKSAVAVNRADHRGITPLMLAVSQVGKNDPEGVEMVRILLNRPDIKINALDSNGRTALDFYLNFGPESWSNEQRQVVEMLKKHNAKRGQDLDEQPDTDLG